MISGTGTNVLKIKKDSAVDKLCAAMKENILNGAWRTNEKIPNEHELAGIYGLNRMTVRAAIQRLSALGILDVRVGDGTYVKPFRFEHLISDVSDFYTSSELVKEAAVFRQIVEGGSTDLIIDNGTPEELEELKKIAKDVSRHMDMRMEAFAKNPDFATPEIINALYQSIYSFHEMLFRMTHNQLLYYAHKVSEAAVCRALFESGERRAAHYHKNLNYVKFHEKIVEAIEAKDRKRCRELLTAYVGLEIMR